MRCRWPIEDVVQEVFAKAVERRSMLTDPANGGAWRWLLAIAFRVLAGLKRREMIRIIEQRACDLATSEAEPSRHDGMSRFSSSIARASQQAMRSEDVRLLIRRLEGLSKDEREILVMRFFEELSHEEIASRLGITPAASRQRVRRLLETIRGRWPLVERSLA